MEELEFTDSRNPNFSPLSRSHIFSTIDKATLLSFCPHLLPFPFYSLFLRALDGRPRLFLIVSKLDDTRKFAIPSRFLPRLPFYPPVSFSEACSRTEEDSPSEILGRAHSRRYCFTLGHLAFLPTRDVTYEKRRNPPARKAFINFLRNELERRLLVLRRTCIRGVPKESAIELLGYPVLRARVKMCYIKQ